MKKTKNLISSGKIADNKKAKFDFVIEDSLEAGIILLGTEVKSLRLGKVSIKEAYVGESNGKLVMFNSNILEYPSANNFNHEPKRTRELLVSKKQRDKLFGIIKREGATILPISIYFNKSGCVKLDLGIAKGIKLHDKRELLKKRDWERQKARIIKEYS